MSEEFKKQFQELTEKGIDEQLEFFLKRYILILGSDWEDVQRLANSFARYTESRNDTNDLNVTEAADFLQKNGKTRTAQERKEELKDIDLDNNGRIAFIEYLLLHYKVMVLRDFFKKKGKPVPKELDLTNDGVGVKDVGGYILEALFTFGQDHDPEVERAIEDLTTENRARTAKLEALKATMDDESKTQVARMKAKHEYMKIQNEDTSESNVALISLMASRKRVERNARRAKEQNEAKLTESKAVQDAEERRKAQQSKSNLANMKERFQRNASKEFTKKDL